jgi:hypothetical protein
MKRKDKKKAQRRKEEENYGFFFSSLLCAFAPFSYLCVSFFYSQSAVRTTVEGKILMRNCTFPYTLPLL